MAEREETSRDGARQASRGPRRAEPATHPIVERGGPDYPALLLDLAEPPEALEIWGLLPSGPAVAIVGTRAATPYGRDIAVRLGRELAAMGITVVSGLARGIDAAAHEGALEAGGPTVAVLPFGVEPVLPPTHDALARRIASHGAVVAERPLATGFDPALFLKRNRIIAGLASLTVVVEAGARSGALSTARVARELGRPCLAVPGDVDRLGSRGTHALLRAGARVCEGLGDVLNALHGGAASSMTRRRSQGPGAPSDEWADPLDSRGPVASHRPSGPARRRAPRAPEAALAGAELTPATRVLAALDARGVVIDELATRLGWDVSRTLAELLPLEWSGVVERRPGARWARRATGVV